MSRQVDCRGVHNIVIWFGYYIFIIHALATRIFTRFELWADRPFVIYVPFMLETKAHNSIYRHGWLLWTKMSCWLVDIWITDENVIFSFNIYAIPWNILHTWSSYTYIYILFLALLELDRWVFILVILWRIAKQFTIKQSHHTFLSESLPVWISHLIQCIRLKSQGYSME